MVEYWNTKGNLPKVRNFTTQRQVKLKTRMKESDFLHNWKEIVDRVSASAFCTGRNKRNWKASLDWILKDSANYTKVLEGKYDDETPQSGEPDYTGVLDKLTAPMSEEQLAELQKDGVL